MEAPRLQSANDNSSDAQVVGSRPAGGATASSESKRAFWNLDAMAVFDERHDCQSQEEQIVAEED